MAMIDAALLLPKILAQTGNDPEMKEVAAKIAWSRVAGERLRRHAVPFRLYRKTLIVSVADAIWQKQLHAMSSEMVSRINYLLRRELVEAIEFRIDPAALRRQPANEKPVSETKTDQPVPKELLSAAVEISDPELRQRFISAAANCIARRESRTHTD